MKPNQAKQLVERAHQVLARGYRAMKVVIIPYTHYTAPLPQVDRTARMMGALRDAVGPDIEIALVDFHGRPASASAALAYIDAVESARPLFVEEVLPPWRFSRAYAKFASQNQRSNRHRRAPD